MRCTGAGFLRKGLLLSILLLIVCGLSATTHAAPCLANAKPCGNQGVPSNDRLCCPGSICGWGNVCNPGCRINGVLYRPNELNPANRCQVCQPSTSLTQWSPAANGSYCSDGNACTQSDRCQAGTCVGSNPVVCPAPDQCHNPGTCNPASGVCSNPSKADGSACDDGDRCTQTDSCQYGTCRGSNPVVCTASDQCHDAGTCDPANGTCSNPRKPDGSACNDGNACTRRDACSYGTCRGTDPVVCTALDQCHVPGTCDPASGACSNPQKPEGSSCDDGSACTRSDTCCSGTCRGSNPVVCTALDQCHAPGTCDPASGACSNPSLPDGSLCNDHDQCTQLDVCSYGACRGSEPVVCPTPAACHDPGICNPATGTCSDPLSAPGTPCDDGNACTVSDSCLDGSCSQSQPYVCPEPPQCYEPGTCDPATGSCSYNPSYFTPCDDGDSCTYEICFAGQCFPDGPDLSHCVNGTLDCDETGVDCGGSCAPCATTCDTPGVCGQGFSTCNNSDSCYCFASDDGAGACANDFFCDSAPECFNGPDDCPIAGSVCVVDTCCDTPRCVPPSLICGSTGNFSSKANAQIVGGPGKSVQTGQTAAGR